MWREWFVQWFFFPGVKQKTKNTGVFVKDWAGIGNRIFLAFSIGLSRLFPIQKLARLVYGPAHPTGVIALHRCYRIHHRNHRAPERAPHIFVASTGVFFNSWNCMESRISGIWGRWSSHLKFLKFHIWSHSMQIWYSWAYRGHFLCFFSSTRARSAGPIVKLFLVCENNFEWCRVHWEGVKGTHILIFCTENWCTSGMSSYSTLKNSLHFGCFWLKVGVISKLCSKKGFFWGRNMCRRQCMCQQKTALG